MPDKERKVTKDQLKNAGLTTGPKGLNKYLNKWNEIGKRPRASDFGSKKKAAKKNEENYPYPHGTFEKVAPLFSALRDIVPSDVKKYGWRGLPIPYTRSDEQKAEGTEGRLKRYKKARNKRISDSIDAEKNRKKVSAFLKENPSLHKDVRGLRLKKGGLAKKKKGMGTKWESKWG